MYLFRAKSGRFYVKVNNYGYIDWNGKTARELELEYFNSKKDYLSKWGFAQTKFEPSLYEFNGDIKQLLDFVENANWQVTRDKSVYLFLLENLFELSEGLNEEDALFLEGRLLNGAGEKEKAKECFEKAKKFVEKRVEAFLRAKEEQAFARRKEFYESYLKGKETYIDLIACVCDYSTERNVRSEDALNRLADSIEEFGTNRQKAIIYALKKEHRVNKNLHYAYTGKRI